MLGVFHYVNFNHVLVVKVKYTSGSKAWVKLSLPFSCGKGDPFYLAA